MNSNMKDELARIAGFKDINMGEFGRHLFKKLLKQTASSATYADVVEQMQEEDLKQYTDESFPPNEHSLINDWSEDAVQDKVKLWREFEWVRSDEIPSLKCTSNQKIKLFAGKIEPKDIQQGELGDCYFLSPLAVLAEKPERIKKLFITTEYNQGGVYAMRICKNGFWQEVVVDDYFPCDFNAPAFSRASGPELWVMLLEKAWAKLHGSYERIEAGLAENVFRDLTGAPTLSESTQKIDELWAKLVEADSKHWVIAASAGNSAASQQNLQNMGLVPAHSYGCLKVIELENMFEDKVKLIQLRNPWGSGEWKGDWADDDNENWTPELKKKAGWTDADDGTFFMCLEDFARYYSRVQICRIEAHYTYASKVAKHKHGQFSLIRFAVQGSGGRVYLSVNQTDERCFARKINYKYCWARMLVVKVESENEDALEEKMLYVGGAMEEKRDTWVEFPNMEAGQYLVYVQLDWPEDSEHTDFSVSSYSEGPCVFLRDEAAAVQDHGDLLRKIYRSVALQEVDCQQKTDFADQGTPDIKRYWGAHKAGGYVYFHFENNDQEASYFEELSFEKFESFDLVKPNKGKGFTVEVPPKSFATVLAKETDPYKIQISALPLQQRVSLSDKRIKQMCKDQGTETKRKNPYHGDQEVDVKEYALKRNGGFSYLVVNQLPNRYWKETHSYKLQGLTIQGNVPGDTEVQFELGPGESKLIQLTANSTYYKFGRSIDAKFGAVIEN